MKGGAQVALAVGVGYILGRRRKMRMATVIAIGAATGGIGGLGPAALKRGMKMLGSTDIGNTFGPQVTEIVSTIRGDLLDAGKAAATTAVSSRIDSLSDTLHERAESFRNPEAAVAGAGEAAGKAGKAAGETARRAGGSVGRLRRRRPAEDDEEYAEQEPNGAEEPVSDEYDEEELYDDELDEPEAVDDEETDEADEAEEPAPRRTRSSRSPVARTRR